MRAEGGGLQCAVELVYGRHGDGWEVEVEGEVEVLWRSICLWFGGVKLAVRPPGYERSELRLRRASDVNDVNDDKVLSSRAHMIY